MSRTDIEWSDRVWNPTTGCDRVSPGCGLPRPGSDDQATGRTGGCYAMAMAKRLKAMGQPKYQRDGDPATSGPGFAITVHPDVVNEPLRWRKPQLTFVNSMSDLFHSGVGDNWIAEIFAVMAAAAANGQTFQVLTKRHARLRSLLGRESFAAQVRDRATGKGLEADTWQWPLPNVWIGVSVENQFWADQRIPALTATPAAVRFLSCEPLLGPVDLGAHLTGIDWVIAGGESGPAYRPVDLDWFRSLRDQTVEAQVPFLLKQIGGHTPKSGGRELDGRTWDQMPGGAACTR